MVHMQSPVKTTVLVACPPSKVHKQRVRLRRYEWSDSEGVYTRVDGGDDEWYIRNTVDGPQAYPHPEFECPINGCNRSAAYEHDNFQNMLRRAAEGDGVHFI